MARFNILASGLSLVLPLLHGNVGDAQVRQFKVCVPDYSVGVMPLIIAKQNGYFGQEQMDVEVIAGRGHLCTMGLIASSFQFTYSPSTFRCGGGRRRQGKGNLCGGKISAASLYRRAANQET